MREVEAFLSSNPSEIVTLILEDYVRSERGLPKLFRDAGLARYWFPVSRMPPPPGVHLGPGGKAGGGGHRVPVWE